MWLMDEKRISGTFVDLRLSFALGIVLLLFCICALSALLSFQFFVLPTFLVLSTIFAVAFAISLYLKTTVVVTFGKNERVEIFGPLMRKEINGTVNYWAGLQPTGGFPNILDLRFDIINPGSKPIVLLERIPVGAVPPVLPVSNQRFVIPRDLLSDANHPGPLWNIVSHLLERDEGKKKD